MNDTPLTDEQIREALAICAGKGSALERAHKLADKVPGAARRALRDLLACRETLRELVRRMKVMDKRAAKITSGNAVHQTGQVRSVIWTNIRLARTALGDTDAEPSDGQGTPLCDRG